MRVLHAAAEIAGQPALLCRGLRNLGVDARSLSFERSWLGYPADIELDGRGPSGLMRRLLALLEHGPGLDILHLHFGTSFLPRLLDVPLLARAGARLVFHFHGCEVRPRARMLANHPVSACSECPIYCVPERQKRLLEVARRYASLLIVSTPDLLEAVPEAEHLPVTLDMAEWDHLRAQATPAKGFVVLHAPSEPNIKGTRHVIAAIETLKAKFPDVRLELIEREPNARARLRYGAATVAVDQLHLGWHGLFAVEAMALGKPVVVYIRPGLEKSALPVVHTDRDNLVQALTDLYEHPEMRADLAREGLLYVRRVHDLPRVTQQLLDLYHQRVLAATGDSAAAQSRRAG